MYENQLVYYGVAGASDCYRVVRYFGIKSSDYTIENEKRIVTDLVDSNPSIERVFVMTNSFSLRRDYRSTISHNDIESWIIFKDLLERHGREIDIRPNSKYLKS